MQKLIILLSLLGTVVLFVDCQVPSVVNSCPENFTIATSGSQNFCYNINSNMLVWNDAEADCVVKGGHLAKIETATENTYLKGVLTDQLTWFGGKDVNKTNKFFFTDGTTLDAGMGVFTNWQSGQPSNTFRIFTQEDCVQILKDTGEWNDADCTTPLKYVCEAPVISMVTCATGWEINPNDTGGINACYKFSTTTDNFTNAATSCKNENATLFRPETQNELDFVSNKINEDFWIDNIDVNQNGTFSTSTFNATTALFPITWNGNNPDNTNGIEYCTIIYSGNANCIFNSIVNGEANDVNCADMYKYVCKITAP